MRFSSLRWIVLVAALLVACQSAPATAEIVSVPGGSYRNISASDVQVILKSKDFLLINVHIPFAGNIAGTCQPPIFHTKRK